MKKLVLLMVMILFFSCGSHRSFQSFFNNHKNDIGVTAFQVPNFMRSLLGSISPEMSSVFSNVRDFKFLTFKNMTREKQQLLIKEMNMVTGDRFTDVLRVNTLEKTKIVSVLEHVDVVKQAIIFNSTLDKTSVFYLKGNFDPNQIKKISEANQFEDLSNKLLQQYSISTPGINPIN